MLNLDLNAMLREELERDDYGNDGMLHASIDIVGPLRHTMLRLAGAPEKPDTIASIMRLQTGTMWHKFIGEMMERRGLPVAREVQVTHGLPEGWTGKLDWLFWSEQDCGFILLDGKTTKGDGIKYIEQGGAKPEHVAQMSAYWHALVNLGYPMVNRIGIWYLPMSEDYTVEGGVQPFLAEVTPLDGQQLFTDMTARRRLVNDYLSSLPWDGTNGVYAGSYSGFLTDALAPPMPREQKLFKDKDKWNLVLVPHWTSMFCPYDDALCNCAGPADQPKTEKIGHFEASDGVWLWTPRSGYEIEPLLAPKGKVPA